MNKQGLNYYFKYGTWFYGNNQSSFEEYYTFKITTFDVKVYKNNSVINTYTYNLNGTYSNTIAAYGNIDVKTWLNNSTIIVDEAICNDATTYDIKVSYSQIVTYNGGVTFSHCGMVFNDSDSKFTKYESVPRSVTGILNTLEIWLLSGNPTDIGGVVANAFTSI